MLDILYSVFVAVLHIKSLRQNKWN